MTQPASGVVTVDEITSYANQLDSGALLSEPASLQSTPRNAESVPDLGRTESTQRAVCAAGNAGEVSRPPRHEGTPGTLFPSTIYVSLNADVTGVETLGAAFFAEDCEGAIVGVYEFTGALERRFVPLLEQRRNATASNLEDLRV